MAKTRRGNAKGNKKTMPPQKKNAPPQKKNVGNNEGSGACAGKTKVKPEEWDLLLHWLWRTGRNMTRFDATSANPKKNRTVSSCDYKSFKMSQKMMDYLSGTG